MKRLWIVFAVLLGLVTVVPLIWWFTMVASGPTAVGPSEDPALVWNRECERLVDNGAVHYLEAIELLHASQPEKWSDHLGELPLSPEIAAWVNGGDAILGEIRAGAVARECGFQVSPDESGMPRMPHLSGLRELAKFLLLRTQIARERRDIELLADTVALMDPLVRHTSVQPTLIQRLVGTACAALMHDALLAPYGWDDVDPAALERYGVLVHRVCAPYRGLDETMREEREFTCWMYETIAANGAIRAAIVMPRPRFYGEVDRRFDLFTRLAAEPVERQLVWDNPIRRDLDEIVEDAGESKWWFLDISMSSVLRAIELDARVVAMQRGARATVAIFDRQRETGQFPASLDFLEGQEYAIDPYTGQLFLYRTTDDGFMLYSAGVDRDDDSGVHNGRFGEPPPNARPPVPPPDGDYVFWPPQDRISVAEREGESGSQGSGGA